MANDDSYNWLQGSWASGWSEESNVHDAQQNSTPHEHPAFADAECIARAAHEAFLQSQSQQQMRSTQSNGQSRQHGINWTMSQSPMSYQSPYFQGRQQSHEQRGFQQHQRHQAPQMPQPQQWEQQTNQQQQYVKPPDISSPWSSYQANATRQAYGPATPASLSQSSLPAGMTASRPTMTPQRTTSSNLLDSQSRMALLDYMQRSGASVTSQPRGRQSPSMQQTARVATSSPRQSAPAPTPQTAQQTRPESRSQTPAQASSTSSPVLDNRNASINAGRYGASLPRNDPNTAASHSAMAPRAHGSNSPAAGAQPMSPRGPAVSTLQSPRPTTAAPATSAPPASHVSSGPYKPPAPQRFLPHSSLHAPPQPDQATGRSQPPKYVVHQSPYTSNQSSTLSGAQSTHNGRAAAGPSSNTAQASRPPVSQQQRAAGTGAASTGTTQSHPPLPARVERGDPLKSTHTPNWRMSSGLPLPPNNGGPAYAPTNAQQHFNLPNAPKPSPQPWSPMAQQASMHGHGQGQPSAKIRRMQDGTKHAVAPSTASSNRQRVSPYAAWTPRMIGMIQKAALVQPFDPRDAALKEAYDPATIARDVLINANKHPTEKPLNHHLEILRTSFSAVTFLSDLSTFRWDLVDPDTGPRDSTVHRPAPPTRPEARPEACPVHQHYQQATGPSVLGSLPFKSPAYQPRSEPAPATAPTPTPTPTPAPAPAIAHPTSYPPRSAVGPRVGPFPTTHPPAPQPAPPSPPVIDLTPKRTQAPPVTIPQSASTSAPAPAPTPTPAPSTTAAPAHPATPSRTVPVSQSPRPKPTPAKKSPVKPPSHSPRSKAYPQPQVVISTSPETMPPQKQKPGRPKRTPGKKVEVAIHNEPNVPFPVFHCKWANCQSELHNMRALQSHVLKGHIPNDINCGWEGCTDKTPMAANNMWTHVREKHIEPVAWALGDGPSVPAPEKKEASMTPSNFQRSGRHRRRGTIIWPVNQTAIEAYSRVYGLRHPKQKAEALKEGGVHWKEGVGCELDQSARRLSTPAKQQLSVDREVAYSIEEVA